MRYYNRIGPICFKIALMTESIALHFDSVNYIFLFFSFPSHFHFQRPHVVADEQKKKIHILHSHHNYINNISFPFLFQTKDLKTDPVLYTIQKIVEINMK